MYVYGVWGTEYMCGDRGQHSLVCSFLFLLHVFGRHELSVKIVLQAPLPFESSHQPMTPLSNQCFHP